MRMIFSPPTLVSRLYFISPLSLGNQDGDYRQRLHTWETLVFLLFIKNLFLTERLLIGLFLLVQLSEDGPASEHGTRCAIHQVLILCFQHKKENAISWEIRKERRGGCRMQY
jgi:hypothetical protein